MSCFTPCCTIFIIEMMLPVEYLKWRKKKKKHNFKNMYTTYIKLYKFAQIVTTMTLQNYVLKL